MKPFPARRAMLRYMDMGLSSFYPTKYNELAEKLYHTYDDAVVRALDAEHGLSLCPIDATGGLSVT